MLYLEDDLYLGWAGYDVATRIKYNCCFLYTKEGKQIYYDACNKSKHARGIKLALKQGYIQQGGTPFHNYPEQIYSYSLTTLGKAWLKLQQ
jgi:hypothetical protein